jgi:malic enzyme
VAALHGAASHTMVPAHLPLITTDAHSPSLSLTQVGTAVAFVVASKAYDGGYATALPKPRNLQDEVERQQYSPAYRTYR